MDVFISLNEDSVRSSPAGAELLLHSNCVLPYEDYETRQYVPGRKVVLFVGRLIDLKGLFLVKSAFEQLDDDWRLVVIGDGPLRAGLEAWATGFEDRISLLGQIEHSEIANHLVKADVLLFPGLHDTAPWASAEAAAAGLPVVCLNLGGVAQMAGDNAVVVDVEPVQDLGIRLARAVEGAYKQDYMPQRNWTKNSMTSLLKAAYS
ncbi:glycosyltransferase [Pseudarthrobacter sp. L1SW]|uniref:glycosyltransferase n=1 Tax=Pseudarthrobacter sp. L1SW TaxID=2851598 RepID=UPI001E498C28|nr:glycosyltransferase [Pseudarthrobacter sp. L1SW]UEL27785.1 glycosyltransferase [Pseudarthrobacter sp. L1SW]